MGKGKVDVVAHSLGARGAVQALARMAYRESAASILNELVLIAPDIDTDIFRQELPLVRKSGQPDHGLCLGQRQTPETVS